MTNEAKRLLSFVRVGEENAVTAKEIQTALGYSPRFIRQLKGETREGSDPLKMIISSEKGYFLAGNEQELKRYVHREYARAKENSANARSAEAAMYKLALAQHLEGVV